jgi:hypothetical protein
LPLARRDVVGYYIASNVVECFVFLDIIAGLSNDYAKLPFPVDLMMLTNLGDGNVFVVARYRSLRFDKE